MDPHRLLGEMTLEEKVGQLFLLAFEPQNIDAAETLFERYFVGGSYLSNDNLPDPTAAAAMTQRIQGYAEQDAPRHPGLARCRPGGCLAGDVSRLVSGAGEHGPRGDRDRRRASGVPGHR